MKKQIHQTFEQGFPFYIYIAKCSWVNDFRIFAPMCNLFCIWWNESPRFLRPLSFLSTHTSGLVEQGVLLIFTKGQQQGAALGWATADAKTSTVNASHYTKNGKILP